VSATSESKRIELAFVILGLGACSKLVCWSSNLQKIVSKLQNLLRKLSYCRRVGRRTQLILQFLSAPVNPPVSGYYRGPIKEASECDLCDSRRMATSAFPLLQGLQLNRDSSGNQPFDSLDLREVVLVSPFLQTQDDRGWSSSLLSSPFLLALMAIAGAPLKCWRSFRASTNSFLPTPKDEGFGFAPPKLVAETTAK
jgi:hypothetical protein